MNKFGIFLFVLFLKCNVYFTMLLAEVLGELRIFYSPICYLVYNLLYGDKHRRNTTHRATDTGKCCQNDNLVNWNRRFYSTTINLRTGVTY